MKEVLITTSDSRLRLYNLDECIQKVKFKGFVSENLQIQSSLNNSEQRVSLGSEDGNIFIFDIERSHTNPHVFKEAKSTSFEFFAPFNAAKADLEDSRKRQ